MAWPKFVKIIRFADTYTPCSIDSLAAADLVQDNEVVVALLTDPGPVSIHHLCPTPPTYISYNHTKTENECLGLRLLCHGASTVNKEPTLALTAGGHQKRQYAPEPS